MANFQSDNRGMMQPKSADKRRLFRAEVLQEIAEYAGNATNNGLKTVGEAVAMDEAEMATQVGVMWRYFIIYAVL